MNKKISKSKLALAILSLIITFLVWQEGLRDSLKRPSVSYDLVQKEYEITSLAQPAIPNNFRQLFGYDDPAINMREFLLDSTYADLTDRNKLIIILLSSTENYLEMNESQQLMKGEYGVVIENIRRKLVENSFMPPSEFFQQFENDKYLYNLISNKFNYDDSELINIQLAQAMFIRIIAIKFVPLLAIIAGTILVFRYLFKILKSKTINWKPFEALDLNVLDMVLLISGGFVVLGEVISPVFSISTVDLLTKNLSQEISQSLKIFFGYLFMALPPLVIVYYQIKSIDNKFSFKVDYFQFNQKPLTESFKNGLKGFLMIIPFVLLTSLLMNSFVENQGGSNPLLEIVLKNDNYYAFFLLFLTTTVLAPLFEEIVFRGVLLPILSRDFGIIVGILTSSFVFAIAHLSIGELAPLLVLGVGLSITRLISGRLTSSIIMHSLWNGLTFMNLFLLRT